MCVIVFSSQSLKAHLEKISDNPKGKNKIEHKGVYGTSFSGCNKAYVGITNNGISP